MSSVQLGADHDCLRLAPDESADRRPQYVLAELRLEGLSASRRVVHHYATGFADLADFFGRLEEHWSGWEGVREWESVEGDLRIEARHQYGHVQLRVTVRSDGPGWGNHGWTATADLTIDPGEQLTQITRDIRVNRPGSCRDFLAWEGSRDVTFGCVSAGAAWAGGADGR
jgi:hypothetical protein